VAESSGSATFSTATNNAEREGEQEEVNKSGRGE